MKKLNLRDVFPHEANDFTPWLKDNSLISDIIKNIDNSNAMLWKTEVACGDYRIDMIYKGDKENYIVENQFGKSDSKHLGQIIIYSQLTNIKNVLWLCEGIGNEHKKVTGMLKDVHIIPIGIEIYDVEDGYVIVIRVFGDTSKTLSYKLDRELKIEYRKEVRG